MPINVPRFPLGNPFGTQGTRGTNPAGPPMFDADSVNKILEPFGISLPGSFSDAGPFEQAVDQQQQGGQSIAGHLLANHPAFARGMDNALIAAALTPQGATAGQNISGVAQGLLGIAPYRRQLAAQQAEVPLQFASTLGGLQAQQAMLNMYKGLGDYYRNMGQAAMARPQDTLNAALARFQMEGAMHPRVGHDEQGNDVAQTAHVDMNGNITWQNDPSLSVADLRRQERAGSTGGDAYRTYSGIAGPEPDRLTDPAATRTWNTNYQAWKNQNEATVAGMVTGNRNAQAPSQTTDFDKWNTTIGKEADKLMYPKFDEQKYINDTQAMLLGTKEKPGPMAGKFRDALAEAQLGAQKAQESQKQFNSQIADYHSQFVDLPYAQQKQYGSFSGYLKKEHGFDPTSNTFAPKPSPEGQRNMQAGPLPGPIPQVAPTPNAAAPTPPPVPGMDPAVANILNMLRTQPQ